jgi:Helix-turn-helix domain of resolvase
MTEHTALGPVLGRDFRFGSSAPLAKRAFGRAPEADAVRAGYELQARAEARAGRPWCPPDSLSVADLMVGPPSIEAARVRELKAQGIRPVDIAKALEISRASVYRVLAAGNRRNPRSTASRGWASYRCPPCWPPWPPCWPGWSRRLGSWLC